MAEKEQIDEIDIVDIHEAIRSKDLDDARNYTSDYLMRENKFLTTSDTNEVFLYKNGIYQKKAENYIREKICEIWKKNTTSFHQNQIINLIQSQTYIERERLNGNLNLIPCLNGYLNLETKNLESFSSKKYFTFQIPVTYDPDKNCEDIDTFLKQVSMYPEDILTFYEMAGYCLWRAMPSQKGFMFIGDGENGKSVSINLLKAFLGIDNICSLDLKALSERFTKSLLYGKLANLYPEVSDGLIKSTADFKALTGGDPITADRKNRDMITFVNHAKLIFSTNTLPKAYDDSYAFIRRWIIQKYPHTFNNRECPYCGVIHGNDKNLLQKLTSDENLSGFLNNALNGLDRLRSNNWNFTLSPSAKELEHEYHRLSNNVKAFSDDCLVIDSEGKIKREDLYTGYKVYCDENDLTPVTKTKFTQQIQTIVTRLEPCKIGNSRAWKGIRLRDSDYDDDTTESTDSTLSSFNLPIRDFSDDESKRLKCTKCTPELDIDKTVTEFDRLGNKKTEVENNA